MKKSKRGNIRKSNGQNYKTKQQIKFDESFYHDINIDFDGDYDAEDAGDIAQFLYEAVDNAGTKGGKILQPFFDSSWGAVLKENLDKLMFEIKDAKYYDCDYRECTCRGRYTSCFLPEFRSCENYKKSAQEKNRFVITLR